jgi:transcriptional regulator of acetoin/glycerol metabolism
MLVRALILAAAEKSPQAARFVSDGATRTPRVAAELIDVLVRRSYETHVRELDGLLWRAMAASTGDTVTLPAELRETAVAAEPSEEQVRAALERAKGNVRRAAAALGLPSRYALYRLMKKHGIAIEAPTE